MKIQLIKYFLAAALLAICSFPLGSLHAQGTVFTYQGRLDDGGNPANGNYDLTFSMFDQANGGNPVAGLLTKTATAVSNGIFTVTLDFGGIFTGTNYWLDVSVRTNGNGVFFDLAPRQAITPTPYAVMANSASNLLGVLPPTHLGAGTAAINISGSAASFNGSLSGNVTGTQGATVVSTVGGVTAANVASAANLANASTSASSANTIVRRDGFGGFTVGSATLTGNLVLPDTTASAGSITSGGNTLFHTFGPQNTFVGNSAGNLTMGGIGNTGAGFQALTSLTFGTDNTATGYQALVNNSTGNQNTASGVFALAGNGNGDNNTAVGYQALWVNANGNNNTACGENALSSLNGGSGNIAMGVSAGTAITTGSNNIDIGNAGFGNESGVIRIGTTQTKAVMLGIFGTTVGGGAAVQVNASGLLGTVTSSARFKQNIEPMATASDVLLALKPVTFQYKPELDPESTPQFGLIAEDVEKIDPDLVVHDAKHQIYSVRYEAVNAMLLNEFLKEHQQVERQNTEIQNLKQSVAELRKLVHSIAGKK